MSGGNNDLMNILADKEGFLNAIIFFQNGLLWLLTGVCVLSFSPISSMLISNRHEWPSNLNIVLRVASSFYATYFKSEINQYLDWRIIKYPWLPKKNNDSHTVYESVQCMSSDFYDFGIIHNPKQLKILKY